MKKILITGAYGRVGRVIADGLRQTGEYEVVATDIQPDPDAGIALLDIEDVAALREFTVGVDSIIHLAWYMKSKEFYEKIVPINLAGMYNLYEAARLNGVRRVIFGSSNHVVGYYRADELVTPDMPMRPDSLYGLGKCWGELVGRMYSDKYGISAINVRIGNFSAENRPGSLRSTRIWISHRDMIQLMIRCIEADDRIKFLTIFGTSGNTRTYYDNQQAALIGYMPQDNGEDFAADIRLLNPEDRSEHDFQGGGFLRHEERAD